MIINSNCLQSPIRVPCYSCTRENHFVFNAIREAVASCTKCRLAILLDDPDVRS